MTYRWHFVISKTTGKPWQYNTALSVLCASPTGSNCPDLTSGLIQCKLWEHIFQMECRKRHGHCIAPKCDRGWRGCTTVPAAYGKSISVFISTWEDRKLYIWFQILPSSSVTCPGEMRDFFILGFSCCGSTWCWIYQSKVGTDRECEYVHLSY